MKQTHFYGEDFGNFTGHFPEKGRFFPHLGQRFAIDRWMPYKSGVQDTSGTRNEMEFVCTWITGKNVQGTLAHLKGGYPYDLGDTFIFNTDVIQLQPLNGCHPTGGSTFHPCFGSEKTDLLRQENRTLLVRLDELRAENERLRSEAGHKDTSIRRLTENVIEYRAQIRKAARELGF